MIMLASSNDVNARGSREASGSRVPTGSRPRPVLRGNSSHCVETLHCTETLPPHGMFYFRATKSFHDNSSQGPDNRAGTSRTAPGSTTLPGFRRTAPHRRPGAVTLPRAGFHDNAERGGNCGRLIVAARQIDITFP